MATRPIVSPITEVLYDQLGPWARRDTESESWQLLELCESVGQLLQPIEDLIRDTDEGPGWSPILDLNRAPNDWLGYLAQYVGVRLRAGLDDGAQRLRIRGTGGFNRGSSSALRDAARQYLIGPDGTPESAYVLVNERIGGNAYQLGIITKTSETPDQDLVLAALKEQKPAGIILSYAVVEGQTYLTLRIGYDTYGDVKAAYSTYGALRSNLPI